MPFILWTSLVVELFVQLYFVQKPYLQNLRVYLGQLLWQIQIGV